MNVYMLLDTEGYYIGPHGDVHKPCGVIEKMNNDNELTLVINNVSVTKPITWFRLLAKCRVSLPQELASRLGEITFKKFGKVFSNGPSYNVSALTPLVLKSGHAIALNWSSIAVSSHGQVVSSKTGKILYTPKHNCVSKWYKMITVNKSDILLHRIILNAWVYNPDTKTKYLANHKDGNKSNNVLSNLEWCSYSDNMSHAVRTGLRKDNIKAYTKHRITLRVTEYQSIHDLCRALGLHNMSRIYFDKMFPGMVIADNEVRITGDDRPWYYVTGKETVIPRTAHNVYKLSIDGVVEKYFYPRDIAKRLGLTIFARWKTVEKAISSRDNVSLTITPMVVANDEYQVYCVKTKVITSYKRTSDIVKATGLSRSVVYKAIKHPENYVYSGYATRIKRDTPWNTDFIVRHTSKPTPIKVTDEVTKKSVWYSSIREASLFVGLSARTLVRYMKLKVHYNQYSFSN